MDMENTIHNATEQTASQPSTDLIKKKLKQAYGSGTLGMLIQLIIAGTVSGIANSVAQGYFAGRYAAENPGVDQLDVVAKGQELFQASSVPVISNAIGYLVANVAAFLIMVAALKAFKPADVFRKPKANKTMALGIIGILGLQGISMFVQSLVENLTGMSGVNEQFTASMSIDDNLLKSVVLVVYMVIIAPITEEMLCRGLVLNSLSPVSRTFALIASSMIFGIMHGNFNQMFNGFLLGLVLGYIALKSGSIIYSIITHMLCNANAMFMECVYSYAIGGELEEKLYSIHCIAMLVIGIPLLIIFFKKNGKINEKTDIITENFRLDTSSEKGELTWKILLTRPSFWVFVAIYVGLAAIMVSPIATIPNA